MFRFVTITESADVEESGSVQSGRAVSISDLFHDLEGPLHGYAATLVHDREWAEDLVQETFIRAWGHLPLLGQLTGPQRRAWLRRVMKNLFVDQCRRSAREQRLLLQMARQPAAPQPDELLPLQIEGLLNTLPEPLRELWCRRYRDGMSGIELARALGVPPATVRSRLHAARQLLRRQVERYL